MECQCIQQTTIPHATRLFTDFLYDFERVRPFYAWEPFHEESFLRAARTIQYPAETRAAVANVLEEQAALFGAGPPTLRNIERFRAGALALVTGQQVGLFTGPAYALYKAVTAVRLADLLTSRGVDCVPVFWLATEDHDLHEVNHTFLLDSAYGFHRLADETPAPVPNAPVGSVHLGSQITEVTRQAVSLLPSTPWTAEVAAALAQAYRPGETLGVAFARLLTRLMGRYGVILMDPVHPRLRALSSRVFRRAVEMAPALNQALLERNKELARAGYHAQVHVTETSALLFRMANGQRTVLRRRNGDFVPDGGLPAGASAGAGAGTGEDRWTPAELARQIDENPADFSPNVLLRPVVQDTLLPSGAYVGGPAELAYFAQAAVLYPPLLGRAPLVYPRASFTLLDGATRSLLGRYGLELTDVLAGPQDLRTRMAPHFLTPELAQAFEHDETLLDDLLDGLRARLEEFDHTLADAAATSARKMTYQLSKIKRKAGAAAGRRSGELEHDAVILENVIHPRKSLQERVYSGVCFLARFGPPLLDQLYERVSLTCPDHQVISLP